MSYLTHTESSLLQRLLQHTGLGRQLVEEADADRAAKHRALAVRLHAARTALEKQNPGVTAAIDKQELVVREAQQRVDAELEKLRVLGQQRSDLHDSFYSLERELGPQLRAHADPIIDETIAAMRGMLESTPTLYVFVPDPRGDRLALNGVRGTDNRKEIDVRAHAILDGIDAAERLKLFPAYDLPAKFDAIRKSIPTA